jgi:transposase
MLYSVQTLPEDPIQLQRIIAQLQGQLAEAQRERTVQAEQTEAQTNTIAEHPHRIEHWVETIELSRRKRFGPSADRIPEYQWPLFDDAELEALIDVLEAQLPKPSLTPADSETPQRKPVRRPMPTHLPRVEHVIDLPAAMEAAMGEDWTFIGYDSAEQLAVIPRQCYVVVTKRAKYVPINEDVPDAEIGVKIAPRPRRGWSAAGTQAR